MSSQPTGFFDKSQRQVRAVLPAEVEPIRSRRGHQLERGAGHRRPHGTRGIGQFLTRDDHAQPGGPDEAGEELLLDPVLGFSRHFVGIEDQQRGTGPLPQGAEDVRQPFAKPRVRRRRRYAQFGDESVYLRVHPRGPLEIEPSAGDVRDGQGVGEHLFGDVALAGFAGAPDRQVTFGCPGGQQRGKRLPRAAVVRHGPRQRRSRGGPLRPGGRAGGNDVQARFDEAQAVDDQGGAFGGTAAPNVGHDRVEQDAFDLAVSDADGQNGILFARIRRGPSLHQPRTNRVEFGEGPRLAAVSLGDAKHRQGGLLAVDPLQLQIRAGAGQVVFKPLIEEHRPLAQPLFDRLRNRPYEVALLAGQGEGDQESVG